MHKKARDIILINGSPRARGNTSVLLCEIEKTLRRENMAFKTVRLQDLKISPCKGCNWCQTSPNPLPQGDQPSLKLRLTGRARGRVIELDGLLYRLCSIKDDMQRLYHDLLACKAVVFAGPVYWDSISAQLKLFIDRLFALMKWKDGKCKSLLNGKKAALVLVAGGGIKDGLADSRGMMRTIIKWCGMKRIGELMVPFVDKPGEVAGKASVIEAACLLAEKTKKCCKNTS